MRQVLFVALAIFTLALVGGCKNAMSDSWTGTKKDDTDAAHNTPQTKKAGDVADASNANAADDSTGSHNAMTDSEDEASRARRQKARESLGMGGGN